MADEDERIEFDLHAHATGFIDSLDPELALKITDRLIGYEKIPRNQLFASDRIKKIDRNLYSVRFHESKRFVRLFGNFRGSVLHLVHGIVKKTNAIPGNDLKTARARIELI